MPYTEEDYGNGADDGGDIHGAHDAHAVIDGNSNEGRHEIAYEGDGVVNADIQGAVFIGQLHEHIRKEADIEAGAGGAADDIADDYHHGISCDDAEEGTEGRTHKADKGGCSGSVLAYVFSPEGGGNAEAYEGRNIENALHGFGEAAEVHKIDEEHGPAHMPAEIEAEKQDEESPELLLLFDLTERRREGGEDARLGAFHHMGSAGTGLHYAPALEEGEKSGNSDNISEDMHQDGLNTCENMKVGI